MLRLRSAARSETGPVRRRNEDRFLCEEALGLFGVADGVGGLPGGAEAAEAARLSLLSAFRGLEASQEPDLPRIVTAANAAVAAAGRTHSPGIATTLTFGCIRGGTFRLGHAGDSRAYVWSKNGLEQITHDHNVETDARRKKARGEFVRPSSVDGQAITRCLGTQIDADAEWYVHPLQAGHRYFFCTDGVTGILSHPELGDFLGAPQEPAAILQGLMALILKRGAPDNATAVLICIDEV